MKFKDSLTIFCSLKGRPSYTKRFLDWCEYINCRNRIVFADGGDDDYGDLFQKYPNLDITYKHFGYDKDIIAFNRKMNLGMNLVCTKYVFMADNDDLFWLPGLARHTSFLETSSDYASSRGSIEDIIVSDKNVSFCGNIFPKPSVKADTPCERVRSIFELLHAHWHDVTRTLDAQMIFRIIDELRLNDLKAAFRAHVFLSVVPGKNRRLTDDPYYLHQKNTARVEGVRLPLDRLWVQERKFAEDMSRLIGAIAYYAVHFKAGPYLNADDFAHEIWHEFLNRLFSNPDTNHKISSEDYSRLKKLDVRENFIIGSLVAQKCLKETYMHGIAYAMTRGLMWDPVEFDSDDFCDDPNIAKQTVKDFFNR